MKLPAQRIAGFLKSPDAAVRGVLVYGPDGGLVRERGKALVLAVSPDPGDPFRVAELDGAAVAADPARLADEMAAQSLIGGRRVVRLREAGDGAAEPIASALALTKGDTLLVVEAGELAPRSALRKLFEGEASLAAIACYADGARDIADLARSLLGGRGIAIAGDALHWLVEHSGGDRQLTRSELEKLALYVGDGGRVGLDEAIASVGDTAGLTVEDAVFAACEGDAGSLERCLLRAFQEGEAPISILRAAARHIERLHVTAARIAGGQGVDDALRHLRPPLFFKHQERFASQLRRWPLARLGAALAMLTEAELRAKRSVYPQETICRAALLDLARAAASQGKASGARSAGA